MEAIIDANLVRAREGLRVLDEVARFWLQDALAWRKLRALRQKVPDFFRSSAADLLAARQGVDVGEAYAPSGQRRTLYGIIRANSSRVGEALRVLEEFAVSNSVSEAKKLAGIRYELYRLELRLARQTPHFWLERYFNRGSMYAIADSAAELIWLVNQGARLAQLRLKTNYQSARRLAAEQFCQFVKKFNQAQAEPVLFIVNDDADLAGQLPAAGLHLGESDGSIGAARQKVGLNKIIGRSNQSVVSAAAAARAGADYVSIGPVFSTLTKPEYSPVGLAAVEQMAREIKIPWLAIGGINAQNIQSVRAAGAKNIAVVSAARQLFA